MLFPGPLSKARVPDDGMGGYPYARQLGSVKIVLRGEHMRGAVLAVATLVWPASASAQDYPNRPIRIIVPPPAGGPVDVIARVLANALPAQLGQNVFVENKPGAGNTIGSRQAAVADPDGHTLMVSAASGLIMSPMIVKNAGYDAWRFAPVALIPETPQVLVVNPQPTRFSYYQPNKFGHFSTDAQSG